MIAYRGFIAVPSNRWNGPPASFKLAGSRPAIAKPTTRRFLKNAVGRHIANVRSARCQS